MSAGGVLPGYRTYTAVSRCPSLCDPDGKDSTNVQTLSGSRRESRASQFLPRHPRSMTFRSASVPDWHIGPTLALKYEVPVHRSLVTWSRSRRHAHPEVPRTLNNTGSRTPEATRSSRKPARTRFRPPYHCRNQPIESRVCAPLLQVRISLSVTRPPVTGTRGGRGEYLYPAERAPP